MGFRKKPPPVPAPVPEPVVVTTKYKKPRHYYSAWGIDRKDLGFNSGDALKKPESGRGKKPSDGVKKHEAGGGKKPSDGVKKHEAGGGKKPSDGIAKKHEANNGRKHTDGVKKHEAGKKEGKEDKRKQADRKPAQDKNQDQDDIENGNDSTAWIQSDDERKDEEVEKDVDICADDTANEQDGGDVSDVASIVSASLPPSPKKRVKKPNDSGADWISTSGAHRKFDDRAHFDRKRMHGGIHSGHGRSPMPKPRRKSRPADVDFPSKPRRRVPVQAPAPRRMPVTTHIECRRMPVTTHTREQTAVSKSASSRLNDDGKRIPMYDSTKSGRKFGLGTDTVCCSIM